MSYYLSAHVPRLVLEWQTEAPGESYRAFAGTMAFTDLSGFTTMSERLARKGKVGAEEVAGILNSTFEKLLAVAYEADGTLLKFGGDALLLFFYGPEHAERACYAVDGMMRTLRKLGPIRSSAGAVRLKMSVGVASGDFHFFCVGSSHRDLLVLGRNATETCRMEGIADGGEILLAPPTAELIGNRYLGPGKEDGTLLAKAPTPSSLKAPQRPQTELDVSQFVPSAIRRHLSEGGDEPEHRRISISFLRFGDTDGLLEDIGPQRLAERLHDLVTNVQRVVESYGICFLDTDIDKDGGKILVVAGVPDATENDEERILRALHEIASRDYGLELKIGVNRGHAFAGSIGTNYRRCYTTIGDTTNTAARVMSKAQPGQVLATQATLEHSQTVFQTTGIPPFAAKGKSKPIVAFAVGRPVGSRQREVSRQLPLMGRDFEWHVLTDALRSACDGQGAAVELVGDPGIGKTRLVGELAEQHPALPFHMVACDQYGSATAYHAFRTLLRGIIGCSADASPAQAGEMLEAAVKEHAPGLLPWLPLVALVIDAEVPATAEVDRLDADFRRAKLHETIEALLAPMLGSASILAFDDAHWLDGASSELLRHLLGRLELHPWLVCIASRPEWRGVTDGVDNVQRLLLRPLEQDDAAALARAAADDLLLPQRAAAVAERAGGNPMYVLELVAASGGDDIGDLPDSVDALIASRIDELRARDRNLLRFAAVIGQSFDLATLRELTERSRDMRVQLPEISEESVARLAAFVDRDGNTLRFRQPLFRQVAYEALPFSRRRVLHGTLGSLLEERADAVEELAALLSLHFHEAQDHERSWRYSLAAATKAEAKFAHIDAGRLYRRALEAAGRLKTVAQTELVAPWEGLGLAMLQAGDYDAAITAFRQGARAAPDTAARARLWRRQAAVEQRLGRQTQAVRLLNRGLRALDADDAGREGRLQRVLALLLLATINEARGKVQEAIHLAEQAAGQARDAGDRAGMGHAYSLLHNLHAAMGSPEGRRYGELALELFEDVGDLRHTGMVLNGLGMGAHIQGDWAQALSLYRRSLDALEAAGNVLEAAAIRNNIAEIVLDQGRLDEARRMFQDAHSTFKAGGYRAYAAISAANRARAEARQGHLEEARASVAEAKELTDGIPAVVSTVEAYAAEVLVVGGEHQEALDLLATLFDRSPPPLHPTLHRLRGYALVQTGVGEEALGAIEESLRLAQQTGSEFDAALAHEILARLGPRESAEGHAAAAQAVFERLEVVSSPNTPLPAPT